MSRMLRFYKAAAWMFVVGLTTFAVADDWPQWRGPTRDDVWRETGLIEKFAGPQVPIRWRAKIGSGYSGPTISQGRVYVTDRVAEPKQIERVHCFDADDGRVVWSYEYDCTYTVQYVAGPRASVGIDDGRAYALGTMGHLHCFDAATGKILWQHDLNLEYRIQMPIWGITGSPLIFDDLLIVQVGGEGACVVAFDKKTGVERWRALDDRASYAAPILVEQAGKKVCVCVTGDNVVGLDAASGEVYWTIPWPPKNMPIAVATPIVSGDRVFCTSFYDGSLMIKLGGSDKPTAEKLWLRVGRDEKQTDALQSIIATPLFLGDYVYGVDSYGQLRCLDAKTGDRLWEDLTAVPKARWSTIHFTQNTDGRTWMFNERGELIIAKLSPQGYEEISRAKLIEPTTAQLGQRGGVCWSHPGYANKRVFIRNDEEIVCGDLAK